MKRQRLISFALVSLLCLSPMTLEAQGFLNKVSKGLDKVNKALDKVNNLDKKAAKKETETKAPAKEDKTSAKPASEEKSAVQTAPQQSASSLDKLSARFTPEINYVHFDEETYFLLLNPNDYWSTTLEITPVSEGIFGINGKKGWSFYRAKDGACLFKNVGQSVEGDGKPKFNNGVVVMRSNETRGTHQPYHLLFADGRMKELPGDWTAPKQLIDGLGRASKPDERFRMKSFYYNMEAQKVFPQLPGTSEDFVRPLIDGRRAMQKDGKWGFVDSNGNWAVQPVYEKVANFSEGYCRVNKKVDGKEMVGFIDTKGAEVFPFILPSFTIKSDAISDVSCGIIRYADDDDNLLYYDVHGRLLKKYKDAEGTPFQHGYAFVKTRNKGSFFNMTSMLVDKDFNIVSKIDDSYGTIGIDDHNPQYGKEGLALVNQRRGFIDPQGHTVLRHKNLEQGYFEPFSDGYALTHSKFDGTEYLGFVEPDGSYSLVISFKKEDNRWWKKDSPWKRQQLQGDPPTPPYEPPLQPADTTVIGPIITDIPRYDITLVASPANGGTITMTPQGQKKYGETFNVTAKPAGKEWRLGGITSEQQKVAQTTDGGGKRFTTNGDMTVTANFVKKDSVEHTPTGAWQGMCAGFPVYLEMSANKDISTPYGEKTYGFMTLMIDPEVKHISNDKDGQGSVMANYLYLPMRVDGMLKENGKRYLMVSGGLFKIANIMLLPNGKAGMDFFMANVFLMLFGNDISLDIGTYRVEIKSGNPENGEEFVFGPLERFSPKYGWMSGGDKHLASGISMGVLQGYSTGLDVNAYNNLVMKPAQKRNDVVWEAPRSWTPTVDDATWDKVREKFAEKFKTFKSDYFKFWGK